MLFHIRDGDQLYADEEGRWLPDIAAARAEARQSARDILADLLSDGRMLDGQLIEIADGDGRVIEKVPLRTVVRLPEGKLGDTLH
jgi:hypothetical protein